MSNIKIATLEVAGLRTAIYSMRNPMNSWEKSDSFTSDRDTHSLLIGDNDLRLAKNLVKAGSEHSKFLRMIQVWADVHMPRYIWQELDTYKFGTKNSTSTMHGLHKKAFTLDSFYLGENPSPALKKTFEAIAYALNFNVEAYKETGDYKYIIEAKRILPESYIQMRTWNTNYAELMNIYHQRRRHRLKEEWADVFCRWCETLPYFKELCVDTLREE